MTRQAVAFAVLLAAMTCWAPASAHCDTTQGPVVTAARAALEARDPDLVLHWVRPEDEPLVTETFQQTLAVRALGPEAQTLADRHFFETLVRIHRAGEGAPFTGLSEDAPEPIILATDKALESGSLAELEGMLVSAVQAGLAERFAAASAANEFDPGDVTGGREFVAAYVPLTHWVEGVFERASEKGGHHLEQCEFSSATAAHHDSAGHPDSHGSPAAEHDEPHRVLWLVTILLAVLACVEAAFLLRRQRHVAT
jgi:hypothetical protein